MKLSQQAENRSKPNTSNLPINYGKLLSHPIVIIVHHRSSIERLLIQQFNKGGQTFDKNETFNFSYRAETEMCKSELCARHEKTII